MRHAITAVATALALAVAACGEPGTRPQSAAPTASAPPAHPDAIWFEVLGVSEQAEGHGEIAAAQTPEDLRPLWRRHRFAGKAPVVDFTTRLVLMLTRPEDSCPDDLVEARLMDGVLETTWLPPPGPCNQPLIPTAYAVTLHRGDLPKHFAVLLREHPGHGGDVRVEITLPPYDGPPVPEPSPPPYQMSAEELDAIFAEHPLRHCDDMPSFTTEPRVEEPLAADSEIAEIQRRRAGYALPSDEATARALRDDPQAERAMGFPMTTVEFNEVMARNRPEVNERLYAGYVPRHRESFGFTLLDQAAGGVLVVGVTADVEGHRRRLAELFPDVPLRVVEAPATAGTLQRAQEELHRRFPHGETPRVLGSGAGGPHLKIEVLDPSRDDLDALVEAVDPAWACVAPVLSGLPRD